MERNWHGRRNGGPRCLDCDHVLRPHGDVTACPGCGQIYGKLSTEGAWPCGMNDGWSPTGTTARIGRSKRETPAQRAKRRAAALATPTYTQDSMLDG